MFQLLASLVMELRQLEYFVAVTEEANFTRAAARLHVAQPGVSAQIRQLEAELGQALLDRSGRTVRLTAAGSAALPYARAALAAVANARLVIDELAGLTRGHVAVGMVTSVSFDLPRLLADFHRDHPAVEITLSEDNSNGLLEGLRAGRFDVALIGSTTSRPTGIETQVVVDQPLVAAVAHNHPLTARTSITVQALADRPLISLPPGSGLRSRLDNACAAAGVRPRIAFEASDPHMLAQLAARGLGVAILPQSVTDAHPDQLHALAVTRPSIRGRIELAWRAEGPTSPATSSPQPRPQYPSRSPDQLSPRYATCQQRTWRPATLLEPSGPAARTLSTSKACLAPWGSTRQQARSTIRLPASLGRLDGLRLQSREELGLDPPADSALYEEGEEGQEPGAHHGGYLEQGETTSASQIQGGHQVDDVQEPVEGPDDTDPRQLPRPVLQRHTHENQDQQAHPDYVGHHPVAGQGASHRGRAPVGLRQVLALPLSSRAAR